MGHSVAQHTTVFVYISMVFICQTMRHYTNINVTCQFTQHDTIYLTAILKCYLFLNYLSVDI